MTPTGGPGEFPIQSANSAYVGSVHISPERLIRALRSQGLRVTAPRRAICNIIVAAGDEHLTARLILDRLCENGDAVDQSTVYRTLDALEGAGLLSHSHLGHGAAVYHLTSESNHQHLLCRGCGSTVTVPAAEMTAWVDAIKDAVGFEVDPTHFASSGRCAECVAQGEAIEPVTDSPR